MRYRIRRLRLNLSLLLRRLARRIEPRIITTVEVSQDFTEYETKRQRGIE